MSQTDIGFVNPVDFAEYLNRHGKMSRDEFEIFKVPHVASMRYCHSYNDQYKYCFDTYEALVELFGQIKTIAFSTAPETPDGWHHGPEQTIIQTFDNKRDLISELKDLGVDREKLKPFEKTKVSLLKEMIDSSSIDDENETEVLCRSKGDKSEKFTFPVSHPQFPVKEVTVVIKKNPRNTDLEFRLVADWKKQWDEVTDEVKKIFSEYKFRVYAARLA